VKTGPVQVGSDRQLFLDDVWFDSHDNIRLRMHTPVAREVALTADRPWESGGVHYSTVIEDDVRNWVDRNPIMGPGILELALGELSMYYTELYREGPEARFRRCTIRTDGFVSVEGPYKGWGEFTTPPLTFSGDRLELNYSTAGGGSIFVEIQDESGTPLRGLSLDNCSEVFGDKIDGAVSWKSSTGLGPHADKPVRLRVRLRDANLYAFRFAGGNGKK